MVITFLLSVIVLVIMFLIARALKSTKVFWTFIIAFCIGFIGGSIITRLSTNKISKKDNVKTSYVQESIIPTCNSVFALCETEGQSGCMSKVESLEIMKYSIVYNLVQSNVVFNPDADIGKPYNTS